MDSLLQDMLGGGDLMVDTNVDIVFVIDATESIVRWPNCEEVW